MKKQSFPPVVSPWDRPNGDSILEEDIDKKYKVVNPWDQPTGNSIDDIERREAAKNYKINNPWDPPSLVHQNNEFDKHLAAMDLEVKHPWTEDANDLEEQYQLKKKAQSYKFSSLFDVPPMTEEEKKKISDYKYKTPFGSGGYDANAVKQEENARSKKKLTNDKPLKTRQPWTYGSLPADPVNKKVVQQKPTSLWDQDNNKNKQSQEEEKMESSGDPILDSLRFQLKRHGARGIACLSRKFRIMDDDGSGTLDIHEFTKGMKECELVDLSEKALKHLYRYFDQDDSGLITFDEFMQGVRGSLNERRKALDKDRSGTIELSDIKGIYNGKSHPDVIQEKRTEEEVLLEFLQSFEVGNKRQKFDGVVTLEEFENYYANLSASIDRDDYFELMIRNSWHISGGEGFAANTSNRRVLVTHSDGRQTVEEVQNDLGLSGSDKQGIINRLKKQGLSAVTINTNGAGDMDNQFEDRNRYYNNKPILTSSQKNNNNNNVPPSRVISSNNPKNNDINNSNNYSNNINMNNENPNNKHKSLSQLLLSKK